MRFVLEDFYKCVTSYMTGVYLYLNDGDPTNLKLWSGQRFPRSLRFEFDFVLFSSKL